MDAYHDPRGPSQWLIDISTIYFSCVFSGTEWETFLLRGIPILAPCARLIKQHPRVRSVTHSCYAQNTRLFTYAGQTKYFLHFLHLWTLSLLLSGWPATGSSSTRLKPNGVIVGNPFTSTRTSDEVKSRKGGPR